MKAFILGAALLLVVTPALAQNQPTTTVQTAPNSINHATRGVPGFRSGAESQQAAHGTPARIVGNGRFCKQEGQHRLRCAYRTMASCKKAGRHTNLACVENPHVAVGRAPRR
jgi:hypothetical protein